MNRSSEAYPPLYTDLVKEAPGGFGGRPDAAAHCK